jgi:ribonuclease P protein component
MKAPTEPEDTKPDKLSNDPPAKASLAGFRLQKHADFQRAYAASQKRQSASMSWFLAPQPKLDAAAGQSGSRQKSPPVRPRVGITAGKVLGKAHERNRIKRRLREALRLHVDLLPQGADLILHPRRVVLTMEFTKLEAEVVRILTQGRAEAARMASRPAVVSTP